MQYISTTPGQPHPRGTNKIERTISRIAPEIFTRDVILRPFKPKPPAADARISSTLQLVYCLSLLCSIPSGPHAIAVMDETLDEADRSWLQSMREDADEQSRLRSLAGKLIVEFIDDELKETAAAVAEVVSLAPVISHISYRKLLETFISSIKNATLLELGLLDGIAQLIQNARDQSDLYLVYYAAYAYQALQYIPNDESSLQSIMRRARVVVSGISGVVSAVKGLDLIKFVEGLEEIQDGLAGAYQVVKIGVAKAVELVENGAGLLDSLKQGFIFGQKCAWYPALRGSDTFIRHGQLAQFKQLVCEAPCRRDAAFQLGVCQRLGEVAADTRWDDSTRQQAVAFLCELYRDDAEWGKQASYKKWILTVLVRLTKLLNREISEYALAQLKDLETSGDPAREELYRAHLRRHQSPLLTRAQDIPDVEEDLRRLKKRQLQDRATTVYVPPRAKANRQASDSTSFDLMELMDKFLENSSSQVFLLLGDSGAGKSTFNRELERALGSSYSSKDDAIPLFIHLPSIDNPEKDLVAKHLLRCDFLEPQIRELKSNRRFTLICDEYDECQKIYNLYTSNRLNQTGQ
ncbi:hypothetical protein BGZ70_006744 [Mortierella alpina]|uniref:Arm-like repeat domain-containing protein n=1 Tax=Mortierella alpina TaxID=64518 RepID=A0A9P6JE44_MORAP|nr:hypothetical protein BGZ70_006744 [Mortierella alpina]